MNISPHNDPDVLSLDYFFDKSVPQPTANFLKRLFDLTFACAAFLASLPIQVLACLTIMIETPGSPIFKQKRAGIGGKIFELYKLRTMRDGTEEANFCTEQDDPRVTRFGKFLRDTKIDELPQLWNIILGDMSVIGPRPLSIDECEHLHKAYDFAENHPGLYPTVRPGLTGLEQIYRVNPLVYSERFEWNHYYEQHFSSWLDIRILLTTVFTYRAVCFVTILGALLEAVVLAKIIALCS